MPLVSNLTAYWNFNEGPVSDFRSTTTYADVTGRGNTLSVQPSMTLATVTNIDFRMGLNAGGNQALDGALAGVGKWTRPLTATEKTALNGGEMWPFSTHTSLQTGCVAYYLLNEASNSGTYADATGRGNTLTRTGTTSQVAGPGGTSSGCEFVSGGYIASSPISTDLQCGNQNFTWFGWVKMNSKPGGINEATLWGQANVSISPVVTGVDVYYQSTTDSINIDVGKGVDLYDIYTLTIPSSSPSTGTWYPVLFEFNNVTSTVGGQFNSGAEFTSPRNFQPTSTTGIISNGAGFSAIPAYTGVGVNNAYGAAVVVRAVATSTTDVAFGNNAKTGWFWFKSANTSALQTLAGLFNTTNNDIDWAVQLTGGVLYFLMGNSAGGFQYCDVAFTDTASWHLLVFWYDKTANTIHINLDHGASTASQVLNSVTPTTTTLQLYVGSCLQTPTTPGNAGAAQQFLGVIDEMGIATGTPTSGDLDTLWNSGAGWTYGSPTPVPGTVWLVVVTP